MNAFLNVNRADGKSGSCEILKSVRLLQLHENEFLPSFLFFFLYPPLNVDVKKKRRILMSARLQPWSFFFSSHYMLASATNMCWWLSNRLGPQISSISRPKYPTSYWTAPLGWLLSISKSMYPTHQIFNHSNQPMLPISVNDTTIHSVTEIWVWFFLLPF